MSTKTAKKPYCSIYFKSGRFKVVPTDSALWLGRYPYSPDGRFTVVKTDRVEAGKILLAKKMIGEKTRELKDIQKEVNALQKVLDKAVVDKYEQGISKKALNEYVTWVPPV